MGMINDSGVPVVCCGEPTEELVPNTTEASGEKHLPVVKTEDGKVTFRIGDEKPLAVYAYCNLHGLWMTEIS